MRTTNTRAPESTGDQETSKRTYHQETPGQTAFPQVLVEFGSTAKWIRTAANMLFPKHWRASTGRIHKC